MSHADYVDGANELLLALDEYGVDVDIIDKIKTTGASRNDVSYVDTAIANIKGLFTEISKEYLQDTSIVGSDKALLIGNTQEIKKEYKIISDNVEYTIVKIIEIKPADYLLCYRLFLKGV